MRKVGPGKEVPVKERWKVIKLFSNIFLFLHFSKVKPKGNEMVS